MNKPKHNLYLFKYSLLVLVLLASIITNAQETKHNIKNSIQLQSFKNQPTDTTHKTTRSNAKIYAVSDHFVTKWKTDNPGVSNNNQVFIPTHIPNDGDPPYTWNFDVDWGDGNGFSSLNVNGSITHTYAVAGTYTIRIRGNYPWMSFNPIADNTTDNAKILEVIQWGTQVWKSMANAYQQCPNLTFIATDIPDLSAVKNMSSMFIESDTPLVPGIENWNTSNVTNMSQLFADNFFFNQDIGSWNTANVTNMKAMFYGCSNFNKYIGDWNTSNVTNMKAMFYRSFVFDQDISYKLSSGAWNTSNVTKMDYMFGAAQKFKQDIGNWNTSLVNDMSWMFFLAYEFNADIGNWDTGLVTNMGSMFRQAEKFNQNIGNWDIHSLSDATDMFKSFLAYDFSLENYDNLLIGWEAGTHLNGVPLGENSLDWCLGDTARTRLMNNDGWTITDGAKDCCKTTFNQIDPICSGDNLILPTTSLEGVVGTWSPAVDNTSSQTYTFTPSNISCTTFTTMYIVVNNTTTPTVANVNPVFCVSDNATVADLNINNATTITDPNGNITTNSNALIIGTYTAIQTINSCDSQALNINVTINNTSAPTVTNANPIFCVSDNATVADLNINNATTITAPNGNIVTNSSTLISGTYTAIQTINSCDSQALNINVTINNTVTPTVANANPIFCVSDNATVADLNINNATTITDPNGNVVTNSNTLIIGTYTAIQTINSCDSQALSINVTINNTVTPTVANANPIFCINDNATVADLNINDATTITDPNGNVVNDFNIVVDGTYTAIHNSCNSQALSINVTFSNIVTPTFTQINPVCEDYNPLGDLPLNSNNSISGTWALTTANSSNKIYTFTPNTGQCATTAQMTITVNAANTPTFTQVTAICEGDTLTALPTTSNNSITGMWNPALDNTTTTTYIFTPDTGQCATTAQMTITVNPSITPTFTQVTAICEGDTLSTLPTTSNNSISGTWSPALDNTTTTTYTFTPNTGQCATTAQITITVNAANTPTFTQVTAICEGDTLSVLPTTSNNSISGTWSPVLNNTTSTTYTFTPDTGQCANTAQMTITVNPNITPTFTQVTAICEGDTLTALPTTSNNSITGTWNPALDNTTTTTYIFTPDTGQCATTAQMTITVNPSITPTFTQVTAICEGDTLSTLPTTSNNSITGTWNPTLDNTTTTTYTFTPDTGQCATTTQITITVNPLPTVDNMSPQTECVSYTLPILTNGNYFTGTNGSGIPLNVGDNIISSQTIYIFADNGTCVNESSFTITINPLPNVDNILPQTECVSYTLPPLTNGNYFTGTNATGIMLNAGENITSSQTIYIYADNGTCTNESNFHITINPLPAIDSLISQTTCYYTLPTLNNGNYFTETNGVGTALNAGDVITTSQTIYIYADNGSCTNETNFTITIYPDTDFTLSNDNIIINNQNIAIMMDILNIYQYAIDNEPFQNNSDFYDLEAGIHTISVKNNCFQHEIDINITVFEIPKYFTPNNDNYHDYWQVNDSSNQIKSILIFDRFGKLIKQINPYGLGWDGAYNNTVTSGEYWYVITLINEGKLRGHFILKK